LYFAGRLGWSLYLTIKLVREAAPFAFDPDKERLWSRCLRTLSVTNAMALSSADVAGPVNDLVPTACSAAAFGLPGRVQR
jgi:hypothetical protein